MYCLTSTIIDPMNWKNRHYSKPGPVTAKTATAAAIPGNFSRRQPRCRQQHIVTTLAIAKRESTS